MTRRSVIERDLKRRKLFKKYLDKRNALNEIINDSNTPDDEKFLARIKLQKLPKNSSKVRLRNRCAITGRPRGTFRKFGIARNKLRELALKGDIPGVIKASW